MCYSSYYSTFTHSTIPVALPFNIGSKRKNGVKYSEAKAIVSMYAGIGVFTSELFNLKKLILNNETDTELQ